jgi:lantibiotic modifying enzyme
MMPGNTAVVLQSGWWVQALARHERSGTVPPARALPALRPAWCDIAESVAALDAGPAQLPEAGNGHDAFAVALQPMLLLVRDRMTAAARMHLDPAEVDVHEVARSFADVLAGRLARIARPAFMADLTGEGAPGSLAGLFERYPVLARLLSTVAVASADAGAELLMRLAADRACVVETLLGGANPGPVVAVEPGYGDWHRHSRSVTFVRFADGRTVVYKPRSLASQARFGDVIQWLNNRLPDCWLRAPGTVVRPGYGWMEYVQPQFLARVADARLFYRRAGVLLAALYALNAMDMHCENVIAAADQPVLIDVETILHPDLPLADTVVADPAAYAIAASVQRTGLLPYVTCDESGLLDRSGLGGDHEAGARNRPRLRGELIEPARYEAELLAGFRLGYDAIVSDRPYFTRLVRGFADLETRVVLRPTSGYARLMDETIHPGLLRDALDRDNALDLLDRASASHRLWQLLVPHERDALWSLDIPLFIGRPATRDLETCDSCHLPGVIERSGLECALSKVAGMGEIDRGEQEWIIRASLAARRPDESHHNGRPLGMAHWGAPAEPGRLLAAATGLGDEIVACSKIMQSEGDQGRVNWIGLQQVDLARWLVLPMGASLADGYLGVALFLAQLARQTGIVRYAQVARRAVIPIPRLLAILADRPDLIAEIGCGGASGLGGISYALARLAILLGDQEIADWARTGIRLASIAAGMPGPAGWWDGLAGCLGAMMAVDREIGSSDAAELAVTCASLLVSLVDQTAGRCVVDEGHALPGFASGPAGVGWALRRFAAHTGSLRYAEAARPALWRVLEQLSTATERGYGWCCGTAGLLLAHSGLANGSAPTGMKSTLAALTERPLLTDLSLCHGELGIAEALIMLETADPGPSQWRPLRRYADEILDAVHRHGPRCATSGGVATPGLLHGLAGIGYGLLRLGFPEAVPSVLLLEPANPKFT